MKSALITGSTDGIGYALAQKLIEKNYKVIIHGRSEEKCKNALQNLILKYPNADIEIFVADLSLIKDLKVKLAEFIKTHEKLDLLVNNAGTYQKDFSLTEDGFEKTFAVNALSRIVIIQKLLPLLEKAGKAQIIDISGMYHKKGEFDIDKIHPKNIDQARLNYNADYANNASKLVNVAYSINLAKELANKNIQVITMHPGAVATDLVKKNMKLGFFLNLIYILFKIFMKTPEQAAENICNIIENDKILTGSYLEFDRVKTPSEKVTDTKIYTFLAEKF